MSRKTILLAAILALALAPAEAQTPVLPGAMAPCGNTGSNGAPQELCFRPPVAGFPLGYQQLTSLAASTALTIPAGATEAFIVCETQAVRWRDDGVAPTAAVGMPLSVGTNLVYTGNLSSFRIIQQAASATCDISYYR